MVQIYGVFLLDSNSCISLSLNIIATEVKAKNVTYAAFISGMKVAESKETHCISAYKIDEVFLP